MGSSYKISVVVPVYNKEEYLRECLDSIVSQSLLSIQIVCINDGSNDSSLDIIESYAGKDNRFQVVEQENKGVAEARNVGIAVSEGEYIAFMDPDDYYPDTNILELLYNAAVEHHAKIAGGSFCVLDSNGDIQTSFVGHMADYTFYAPGFNDYSDYQYDYGFMRFIYQKSLIDDEGLSFPPLVRFQDPPFFITAMIAAGSFYAIPEITYCYREGHQNIIWDTEKTSALLRGLILDLQLSSAHHLAKLHRLTCLRINEDYREMINGRLRESDVAVGRLLCEANLAVDSNLLSVSGEHDVFELELVQQLFSDAQAAKELKETLGIERGMIDVLRTDYTNLQDELATLQELNSDLHRKVDEIDNALVNEVEKNKALTERLADSNSHIKKVTERLADSNSRIEDLKASNSYRVGRVITAIPRKAKKALKHSRNFAQRLNPHKLSECLERENPERLYRIRMRMPRFLYPYCLNIWYANKSGHKVDWRNPAGFNDKMQWIKLNDSTPEKGYLADKYRVREWISDQAGSEYLVPLIGVYNSPDEIDFLNLPDKYVIKATHGSGWNIVVSDSSSVDVAGVIKDCQYWLDHDFAYWSYEMHYRYCEHRIIIEEWQDIREEIQFWCFNGRAEFIGFIHDPHGRNEKAFFDRGWNRQDFVSSLPEIDAEVKRPEYYDQLLVIADRLSKGFCHVRVDFLCTSEDKVYFSEMTFTSGTGLLGWHPAEQNEVAGKLLSIK